MCSNCTACRLDFCAALLLLQMVSSLNSESFLQRWLRLRPMNARAMLSSQRQPPPFEKCALAQRKTIPVNHTKKKLIDETELVCRQIICALPESEVLAYVIDVVAGQLPHGKVGLSPASQAADLVPQFGCWEIHQLRGIFSCAQTKVTIIEIDEVLFVHEPDAVEDFLLDQHATGRRIIDTPNLVELALVLLVLPVVHPEIAFQSVEKTTRVPNLCGIVEIHYLGHDHVAPVVTQSSAQA